MLCARLRRRPRCRLDSAREHARAADEARGRAEAKRDEAIAGRDNARRGYLAEKQQREHVAATMLVAGGGTRRMAGPAVRNGNISDCYGNSRDWRTDSGFTGSARGARGSSGPRRAVFRLVLPSRRVRSLLRAWVAGSCRPRPPAAAGGAWPLVWRVDRALRLAAIREVLLAV